jgi:holin-like protein
MNHAPFHEESAALPMPVKPQQKKPALILGLVQILIFQGLGELLSKFVFPALPGPVFGLILLLAVLTFRGQVSESLSFVSEGFSQHLGILFVPAAVGVVLFLPQLRANFLGLLSALLISVASTIAVTAIVLKVLDRDQ